MNFVLEYGIVVLAGGDVGAELELVVDVAG